MLDMDTAMRITSAVRARVAERDAFTAYDVTRQVRAQGVFLKHEDSRALVHDLFEQGLMGDDYCRILVDLGGANGPAYMYYHFQHPPFVHAREAAGDSEE